MGRLIVAMACALLSACATSPATTVSLQAPAISVPRVKTFGTLSVTAEEAALAPLLTRIAVLADRATTRLAKGRTTKAIAEQVRDLLKAASADVATAQTSYGQPAAFESARRSAALALDRAESVLETRQ